MENRIRKIKAVSIKNIAAGRVGFLTEEEANWYNVDGEEPQLNELVKNVLAKGNKIEFEYGNGIVGNLKLIEKAKEEKKNFADDMTNFEDLLNDAHTRFKNMSITTEMLQVDFEKKTAVFKATVILDLIDDANHELCRKFEGHGDACGIGSKVIEPHFMRMAETRAIARALRFATNNAKVAAEETE